MPPDVINGPFYRNPTLGRRRDRRTLEHGVYGRASPWLSDKTWFGVVPFACVPPKPGWPSDPNSGGDLVGAHSGPDFHDHPQVIIHAPNDPFGHTDEMYADHPDGADFLMGDGSVRFVKESIYPWTWVGLSTRDGGEVIDQ